MCCKFLDGNDGESNQGKPEANDEDEAAEEGGMKTAAQKKKEKRERQKKEKVCNTCSSFSILLSGSLCYE